MKKMKKIEENSYMIDEHGRKHLRTGGHKGIETECPTKNGINKKGTQKQISRSAIKFD